MIVQQMIVKPSDVWHLVESIFTPIDKLISTLNIYLSIVNEFKDLEI
ncbi:hypothetical protein VIBNIAM115_480043 [Vibrio nigripulchritudo AM115]|nr:hypothetical protein VIBNIAM115_480043 [Vibrio nigripulchritudo AM115]